MDRIFDRYSKIKNYDDVTNIIIRNNENNDRLDELDKSISYLQTLRLKINGKLEENLLPTKRKIICTEKEKGVECGNIVYFGGLYLLEYVI
jgi:hypothetical protein